MVQLLSWRRAGMPPSWPVSDDPATLKKIQAWLDEVGTRPGIELMRLGESRRRADRPTGDAADATAKERR